MTSLTSRQSDVLSFISSFQAEKGFGPSYREIADGIGLSSKSGVHRIVMGLEERGAVRRLADRSRAVEVIGEQRAEFHLKAILAEVGRSGAVHQDSLCVIAAMQFMARCQQ